MTQDFDLQKFQDKVLNYLAHIELRNRLPEYLSKLSSLIYILEELSRLPSFPNDIDRYLSAAQSEDLSQVYHAVSIGLNLPLYRDALASGHRLSPSQNPYEHNEDRQLLARLLAFVPEELIVPEEPIEQLIRQARSPSPEVRRAAQDTLKRRAKLERAAPHVSSEDLVKSPTTAEYISQEKAAQLLRRSDIRAILCPALQSVSNDAFEIAKIITPILAGLAIAGTIAIPLVPVLFASIALVISRSGIASLCAEYGKAKDKK